MNILFVCTGNTCRSPMAEALARHRAEQFKIGDWEFASAGITVTDERVSKEAVEVMRLYGEDIDRRKAVQLNASLAENFDMVLTMTAKQAEYLQSELPDMARSIMSFGEYIDTYENVFDPYGMGKSEYERCAVQLCGMVDRLLGIK